MDYLDLQFTSGVHRHRERREFVSLLVFIDILFEDRREFVSLFILDRYHIKLELERHPGLLWDKIVCFVGILNDRSAKLGC